MEVLFVPHQAKVHILLVFAPQYRPTPVHTLLCVWPYLQILGQLTRCPMYEVGLHLTASLSDSARYDCIGVPRIVLLPFFFGSESFYSTQPTLPSEAINATEGFKITKNDAELLPLKVAF
jgi:hypothetical protein